MTVLQASDASKHIQVPSGFEDKPAASLSSNHVMSKESLQASVRSAHATTPASQAEKQPKSNDLRYRTCQRKACWLAASILELSAFQESHGQRSGGFMSGLGFQSCGGSAAGAVGAVGAGAGAGAAAAAAAAAAAECNFCLPSKLSNVWQAQEAEQWQKNSESISEQGAEASATGRRAKRRTAPGLLPSPTTSRTEAFAFLVRNALV